MKNALYGAAALALLGIAAFFGTLTWVASKIPNQVSDLRGQLNTQAEFARAEVARQIDATRVDVLAEVDKQATGIRADLFPRVDTTLGMIDQRTAQALGMVDSRTKDAISQVAGLRSDIAPVLTQSAALVKDLQDSVDDLYPDVKATVESATVTVASIAVASEAVRDSAPQVAASFVGISNSANGIAADAHTFTSKFTGPRTKKQKLWDGIKTSAFIGVRLIP